MIEKNCMRNLLIIWKISTEKNFGKSKQSKKMFTIFYSFFFQIFSDSKNFCLEFFSSTTNFFRKYFCDFVSIFRGSRASAASRPPEASHQPPKAASVRVFVEKLSLKGKRSSLRSRTYKNETFFSFCYIVYKIEL